MAPTSVRLTRADSGCSPLRAACCGPKPTLRTRFKTPTFEPLELSPIPWTRCRRGCIWWSEILQSTNYAASGWNAHILETATPAELLAGVDVESSAEHAAAMRDECVRRTL